MKKLLITGFDPFGGECVNPSWEAVSRLPQQIGEYQLTKLQIPTVFGKAAQAVLARAETLHPDAIVCVGQAGGRNAVTPEQVAINLRHAKIADNEGQRPQDMPVAPDGPAAYFATVPVRAMEQAILAAGLPGAVSYSAGTFVCNDLLYSLLHACRGTGTLAGFIHVPYLPQQAEKTHAPSLTLEQMVQALTAAILALP